MSDDKSGSLHSAAVLALLATLATGTAAAQTAPRIFDCGLRIRPTRVNGPAYRATNLIPSASTWYELRVVVEPTRDIDGTSGGTYGVATVYVRDLTAGQTTFTQLVFDDITTTSAVESLTEIPLWLSAVANTTSFDGWELYGYGAGTQIDALSATLAPN